MRLPHRPCLLWLVAVACADYGPSCRLAACLAAAWWPAVPVLASDPHTNGPLPATPRAAGAVSCLQQAVSLYTDMGRLGMAARQLRVRRLLHSHALLLLPETPAYGLEGCRQRGGAVHAAAELLCWSTSSSPRLLSSAYGAVWRCSCCGAGCSAAPGGVQGTVSSPALLCHTQSPGALKRQEIGEVLEKEGNKEESIMFYEQAADLFATENSTSEANKCNLKVGGNRVGCVFKVFNAGHRELHLQWPASATSWWVAAE